MSEPGWFPDPGGTDRLRWWDGRRWTAQLRARGPGTAPGPVPPSRQAPPPRRMPRLLPALVAVAVALAVVVVVVLVRPGRGPGPGSAPDPVGSSTTDVCPAAAPATAGPPPESGSDRVRSGRMSVPGLGTPWRTIPDDRVPFGRGMLRQQISVDDDPSWVVSLNVGTMVAGDGFLAPEQGVQLVMPCLIAEYYRDVVVQREDVVDEAMTVDGHPGWVLETELTFDIEGLDFDSERLVLIIVDLDDGTAGAVVVDLPAIAQDREPELRAALDGIRIDP